ncbi:DNA polymerase epsilon subunit 3-like [Lolium rigidum]|uniref:DNA polymerase epsilon subunit 3-like n=1 Tax=Lolium rigidum TaxID=89674 RepID=UPI001F5D7256|nr:DNA polymerase epsilon subunit 3-like [Lolium rigidum]
MAGETKEQQDAAQGDVAAKPKPKPAVAADAPAAPMTEAEVEELPKTIVRRLVKDKLAQIAGAGADGEGGAEVIVNKDAMAAFSESARIFIHYLSATANDMCKDAKRQTINAEDVFKALDEIDFPEFVEPLRTSLEEFRTKNAARKPATAKKQTEKKRKLDNEPAPQEEQNGAADEANPNADED